MLKKLSRMQGLIAVSKNFKDRKACYSSDAKNKAQTLVTVKSTKYENIPVSNIRNFSIIAHVDHGKSTLADRILEITGTMQINPETAQVLDRLQVERERGITVKAVTASLLFTSKKDGQEYLLNLVDTPGHVDFTNEVSRSLAACQSVVLLVDANEGVQAQTYANFYLAFFKDLVIIPALNKIDLKNADPARVEQQMKNLFDIDSKDILKISAKFGTGVEDLLERIIACTPPPPSNREAPFKGLVFDSFFQTYRGSVIQMFVKDGQILPGDTIVSAHSGLSYVIKELGIVNPNELPTGILKGGQIGYVTCNMRTPAEAIIGDTFYSKDHPVEPFAGFKPTQPTVFAGIYPADPAQHTALRSAIEKLMLTDSAVSISVESSPALGCGWRLGFLGLLHLEVFNQRLDQEYDAQTIMTAPSVTYKVKIQGAKLIKEYGTDELLISNPLKLPPEKNILHILEPIVLGTIITPVEYMGSLISLCMDRRGIQKSVTSVDNSRIMIQFLLPLNEIMIDFNDSLKGITSGFASFDYEEHSYEVSDLVLVNILINGNPVNELSVIVHKSKSRSTGKEICEKLTKIIPRQLFKIAIQAAIGAKIIARETISPYSKNVSSGWHGGDVTRKWRRLSLQAKGKERMRKIGNIDIPRDMLIKLLKK